MTPETPVNIEGYVSEGFEQVRDAFRTNFETGIDRGSAFAAYYRGELVVNIWGGVIEEDSKMYWRKDSMPCFYSMTKAVCAYVFAHLVDRGLLDYREKISKYWPEFAQNGKQDITLETYMSNQAGLVAIDEPMTLDMVVQDPERLAKLLAKQTPLWKPGTKHGYHAITYSLYLDEILKRVDPKKRNIAQYFREEIAVPFDIDFYIGLPKELFYRSTRVCTFSDINMETHLKDFEGDLDIFQKMMTNPPDILSVGYMNNPYMKTLPIGSSHGHGTAESVAKLHGILANGGIMNNKRLLSEKYVAMLAEPRVWGVDISGGLDHMWGLGPLVVPVVEGVKTPTFMFGHGGFGGQVGMADPLFKVGFAFGTNHLHPIISSKPDGDQRWIKLYDALYECIHKKENIADERKTFHNYTAFKKYQRDKCIQHKNQVVH